MTLSRDVPLKISSSLKSFVVQLCQSAGLNSSDIIKDGIFAVHPGGPKIIQAVKEILELKDSQVQASFDVLFERGNMSSATKGLSVTGLDIS